MYFIALFYCKLGDTIIREDINSKLKLSGSYLFISVISYQCIFVKMSHL